MATPPPEATPVLKEEKPQLPPSPNGANIDIDRTGAQDPVADITTSSPEKPSETPDDTNKQSTVNGHAADQSSLTNGVNGTATASPPKSPALPTADTTQTPASAPEATPTAAMDPPTTSDIKGGSDNQSTQDQSRAGLQGPDGSADLKDAQPQQNAPDTTGVSLAIERQNATEASQESAMPAVQSELPHHPSPSAKPSTTLANDATTSVPPMPALQPLDQEMKDAPDVPASPTKVSRERELDPSDEPLAKRTKVGGDSSEPSFKVPELPTPAEAPPQDRPTDGEVPMTKMQHKFLLKSIQSLKRMHDSRFYREPVDPIKLNIPHYFTFITRPMDLGTIERKLKANEYPTVQSTVDDLYLMVQNAATFNGPDHVVAQEGQRLKATFDKHMANLPKPDEVEEKKSQKVAKAPAVRREPRTASGPAPARPAANSPSTTTFALGPEGLPLIRRDSTNPDGRPKRSIHPPKRDLPYSTKPKKKKYQWELKFCQEVLDELHKPKHYSCAAPFYYPVDPVALNIPTYHSIIKKPMDLSTVQTKLKTGQYENAKEFELDMRLIFKNCFKFNIPGDPTYVAGQMFQELFDSKWAQKSRYLEAHEPHPEHHSVVDSSEEESEEEADESDDDDEKLSLLQKQIAEMSRQVEAITQKKKKTPPTSKKLGKSKSSKKDPKKSSSMSLGKKDKKSSKTSKPEKQRWVSYHEKQIISNGISSLPDKKMQEALKIIQNNVPALKGTQETEIELDIDELPNEVLLMLLKFVKKNAPHVMEDEETTAPVSSVPPAKPKKNKPMSKFEQEAQINMLESNLSRFQGASARSPDPVPSVEANVESSDEDDDSEESEEE